MKLLLEKNVAELIFAVLFIAVLLSSCGVTQYSSCNGVDGGGRSSTSCNRY